MDRVIFVDIDDVLLTDRAYLLPANIAELAICGVISEADPAKIVFDPVGIAALNRLAELADARFVLSTSWRRVVGVQPTIDALARNGLDASSFHTDLSCPVEIAGREISKARAIEAWLNRHPVDRWVSLDDDDDLVEEMRRIAAHTDAFPFGQVVWVDSCLGISTQAFASALQTLTEKLDPILGRSRVFQPKSD